MPVHTLTLLYRRSGGGESLDFTNTMLLLPLLSMVLPAVSVAALPLTLNTACNGHACSPGVVENMQHTPPQLSLGNASLTSPSSSTATDSELTFQKQSSSGTHYRLGENTVTELFGVEEAVDVFGRVLESIGAWLRRPRSEHSDQPAPGSWSQYLRRLTGLPGRHVLRQVMEFVEESYLNTSGLQEMLTDLEETLHDLNSRLGEPWFPLTHEHHNNNNYNNNNSVNTRTKRNSIFIGMNVISFVQVSVLMMKTIAYLTIFLYRKINIRA